MQQLKKLFKCLKINTLFFFPQKAEFLLQQGIYIDPVFFKEGFQGRYVLGLSKKKIKVADLRRREKNITYSLDKSYLYQYLNTPQENRKTNERFETLIRNIEKKGFDPKSFIICKYRSNLIKDGQHRAIYMLWKYGPNCELNTLHVRVKKDLLRFKICPWLKKLT